MVVVTLKCRCYNEQYIQQFEEHLSSVFGTLFLRSECMKSEKCWWECKFLVQDVSKQEIIDCSKSLKATHIIIHKEKYDAT